MPKGKQRKKRLKVAVVGIPMSGRAGGEIFKKRVTKKALRGIMKRLEKNKKELKKLGISLEIKNLGELTKEMPEHLKRELDQSRVHDWNEKVEEFNRKELTKMGEEMRGLSKKYDEIICIGQLHTGAYPLYFLPGNVLAVDQHTDVGNYFGFGGYRR